MLDDNSICCVKSMAGGDCGRVGEAVGDMAHIPVRIISLHELDPQVRHEP